MGNICYRTIPCRLSKDGGRNHCGGSSGEEVANATEQARTRKAPGPDEVTAELLKIFGHEGITMLTKMFNKIYSAGQISLEWLLSTFMMLPNFAAEIMQRIQADQSNELHFEDFPQNYAQQNKK
jgi:hypothetical protein